MATRLVTLALLFSHVGQERISIFILVLQPVGCRRPSVFQSIPANSGQSVIVTLFLFCEDEEAKSGGKERSVLKD
jgi:hypothetical protein